MRDLDREAAKLLNGFLTWFEEHPESAILEPLEDVEAWLREHNAADIKPLVDKVKTIVSVPATGESGAIDGTVLRREELTPPLTAWLKSLGEIPSLRWATAGVLGADEPRSPENLFDELKQIPLTKFFDASVLGKELPWAGPTIRVARTTTAEVSRVRYAVSVDVQSQIPAPVGTRRLLHIRLTADDGATGQAVLSPESPAGVLVGEELPAEWQLLSVGVSIRESELDG